MMSLSILLVSLSLNAGMVDAVLKNREGTKLLEQEKNYEASQVLSDAVVNSPEEGALSYNLGLALERSDDAERAIKAYESSGRNLNSNENTKFQSYFNAARLAGEKGQVELALSYYQKALETRPESVEVKTNIELLLRGGGGGQGQQNQQQKQNDKGGDNKGEQQQPKEDTENKQDQGQGQDKKENPKPKPKPFKSENLSPSDAKKVLDELKRQEEAIRAKFNEKRSRETPVDKDW